MSSAKLLSDSSHNGFAVETQRVARRDRRMLRFSRLSTWNEHGDVTCQVSTANPPYVPADAQSLLYVANPNEVGVGELTRWDFEKARAHNLVRTIDGSRLWDTPDGVSLIANGPVDRERCADVCYPSRECDQVCTQRVYVVPHAATATAEHVKSLGKVLRVLETGDHHVVYVTAMQADGTFDAHRRRLRVASF